MVTLPVRPRQLVVTPFYTDRLVAIAPPDWRWRGRRSRGHHRHTDREGNPLTQARCAVVLLVCSVGATGLRAARTP